MLGLSVLLLSASCVPPQMLALAATPTPEAATPHDRIVGTPSIPKLLRAPTKVADAAAFIDATALPTAPATSALPLEPAAYDAASMPSPMPAAPFQLQAQDGDNAARALDCLTAAIYYEARSEPVDGQRAVAQVVLNRVRSPSFPASVCGVVYQGSNRSTGCQFTFTCDGSLLMRREPAAWERARVVAQAALDGSVYEPVGSATFYHTAAVSPWWAPSLSRVAQIGSHIFYRWPGAMGSAPAFNQRYGGVEPGQDTVGGGAFAAPALGLASYHVDGGTVTVHRGLNDAPSGPTSSSAPSKLATVAGVRIHTGLAPAAEMMGSADAPAPDAATATGSPGPA